MGKTDEHPTVQAVRKRQQSRKDNAPLLEGDVRQWALELGADDVGFVSIDREEIADQREDILACFPETRTLVSFVCRMNRESIRTPARSVSNLEFHATGEHVNLVARRMVTGFESQGVRAVNPAMGFPMEMDKFPSKVWVVSHKPVAVAAGLGQMGIHRNVIHPKFGNFILLGTVLIDREISSQSEPIDYNPCLECKLCVAACPVGAISPTGEFDFNACYTHNYREFMGGFTDWIEGIAASRSRNDYRSRYSDSESASFWQSLSYGANYKAAYCLAVCPAGEDVIAPWLDDKKTFMDRTLRPLQEKEETVYVVPGSDAEQHVKKRFANKKTKQVRGSLHPKSIEAFLKYMPLQFQRGQAKGLSAVYHFSFTGQEIAQATVKIANQQLEIVDGHVGECNLLVTADSKVWLQFLKREIPLAWALFTLRIRLWGSPLWLLKFGKCFPS